MVVVKILIKSQTMPQSSAHLGIASDPAFGGWRQLSVPAARHPTAKCIMVTPPEA